MKRRNFLHLGELGLCAAAVPAFGRRNVSIEEMLTPVDTTLKKQMADVSLNAARSKGASYADVRIGRYINQFITTRERRVDNVANTESYGLGVRVIANGCWGFAATDNMTNDGIAKAAALAVQIAKANSKLMDEPVQLAPEKGHGEVSWKTPILKNALEVPLREKIDFLLAVNKTALD